MYLPKAQMGFGKYIAACFDKISHGPLVAQLAQSHPSIARQCKAWLKAGVVDNG